MSNATFIVGDDDVIVIDTGLSRAAGDVILEGLRRVSDKLVSMPAIESAVKELESAVRILHASAAIGEAVYEQSAGQCDVR